MRIIGHTFHSFEFVYLVTDKPLMKTSLSSATEFRNQLIVNAIKLKEKPLEVNDTDLRSLAV